ncbi:MAG: hypothetical protein KJ064_14960 [Anaerolineae bacterium]|nr:MAG: hypothetical protein F9K27_11320 [Anaerolineae bacterium]MCL4877955.1 hypothetical protein [Anaerolineae bacterium]
MMEIEPISPEQAAAIIEPKLEDLQAQGWKIISATDYAARLTRDKMNLDVWVDLLGQIEMQEKPLTLMQESGQIIAVVLLIMIVLFVLVLLSVLGL